MWNNSGFFENVLEFTRVDSPSLSPDKQCIYGFSGNGAVSHYVDRFEYVDGTLAHVAKLGMLGNGQDAYEQSEFCMWGM